MPAHTTVAAVPPGGDSFGFTHSAGQKWRCLVPRDRGGRRGRASGGERRTGCNQAAQGHDSRLLQLAGPSKGPFVVTLSRASDTGIEVLGGVLVRARSAGVHVAVHAATTSDAGIAAALRLLVKAAAVSAAIAARGGGRRGR